VTPLEALKKSVHCIPSYSSTEPKLLECHKCGHHLPQDRFKRLSENRGIIVSGGSAGRGGFILYLHPWCHDCRRVARRDVIRHPHYSRGVDKYFYHRMASVKSGARSRNIVVALDHDDILRASLNQGNKCAITRLPMTFAVKGDDLGGRMQASVDRIDSRWNYTIDNIQIVCAVVNTMKNNMQTHELLRWCALILDGRRKAEMEILDATDV
jgi:hypothetical protein